MSENGSYIRPGRTAEAPHLKDGDQLAILLLEQVGYLERKETGKERPLIHLGIKFRSEKRVMGL
jgi:hypothetical protein